MTLSFFLHLHCLIFSVFPWGKPTVCFRGVSPQEVQFFCVFWRVVLCCFSGLELRNTGAKWQGGREAVVWDNLCVGIGREGRLTNRTCENSRCRGVQRVADTDWVSQDELSPLRELRWGGAGDQLRLPEGLPAPESPHSPPSLLWHLHIFSSYGICPQPPGNIRAGTQGLSCQM